LVRPRAQVQPQLEACCEHDNAFPSAVAFSCTTPSPTCRRQSAGVHFCDDRPGQEVPLAGQRRGLRVPGVLLPGGSVARAEPEKGPGLLREGRPGGSDRTLVDVDPQGPYSEEHRAARVVTYHGDAE